MDGSVVAAPVTNDSIEDEELPSDDRDVSIIINNRCWTDFVGRQQPFAFSGQGGLLKPVSLDRSPLDVFRFWWMRILFVTLLQKQIGIVLHKRLRTGFFPNLPG